MNQDGLCAEGKIPGASARTGNPHYTQDAQDAAALGFDGLKFDAGGGNDNMTLWAEAVNATGREILLENCNNGGYVPYGLAHSPHWHWDPERDPPMVDQGCPFNMFRVGSDIAPSPLSTVSNLLQAAEYLNVSKPGCWAYPDMLELGAPVVGPHAARYQPSRGRQYRSMCNASDGTAGDTGPRLSMEQAKAQFAGWCTVSSPLVLGFDMANETEYDRWFPLLSNPRALAIQAAWAGSAGKLVASGSNFTTIVPHGCSCEAMSDVKDLPEWTVWSKPLAAAGTSVAALVINTRQDKPASVSVPLAALGVHPSPVHPPKATEVWSGVGSAVQGAEWKVDLGPGGHRWVIFDSATAGA